LFVITAADQHWGRVGGNVIEAKYMKQSSSNPRPFLALALVLIHLVISTAHGWAHQGAMVALTTFGYVYVVVVITLMPFVAAGLLFTRMKKIGALLLAFSMLGSFIFGFWFHFLSNTNDNVSQVHGPWHSTFIWTAIALAVIELAGTVVGFRLFRVSVERVR
jgi:cation transport ATPase